MTFPPPGEPLRQPGGSPLPPQRGAVGFMDRAAKIRHTRQRQVLDGARTGRLDRIPFGWRIVPGGPLWSRVTLYPMTLEHDPGERAAMALVVALRAQGMSWRQVSDALNEEGWRYRGGDWDRHKVRIAWRGAKGLNSRGRPFDAAEAVEPGAGVDREGPGEPG